MTVQKSSSPLNIAPPSPSKSRHNPAGPDIDRLFNYVARPSESPVFSRLPGLSRGAPQAEAVCDLKARRPQVPPEEGRNVGRNDVCAGLYRQASSR